MKVERIEYFRGMYSDPSKASVAESSECLCLDGDEIPAEIRVAFAAEKIDQLQGEYGHAGIAVPEEVSGLDITADGWQRRIRVHNHGISMVHESTPELARLFRFFIALRRESGTMSGEAAD